jgi:hypothetical protein
VIKGRRIKVSLIKELIHRKNELFGTTLLFFSDTIKKRIGKECEKIEAKRFVAKSRK